MLAHMRVKQHLTSAEVEKLFIPLTYQGSAQVFIDRLVMSSSTRAPRRVEPRAEFDGPRPNRKTGRTSAWWSRGCRTRRNCRRSPTLPSR